MRERLDYFRRNLTDEERDLISFMWWFTKAVLITYALVDIGIALLH